MGHGRGWGRPESVIKIQRDGYGLRLTCSCGRTAEPDIGALREALRKKPGYTFDLIDLKRYLRCSVCGAKDFSYEVMEPPD